MMYMFPFCSNKNTRHVTAQKYRAPLDKSGVMRQHFKPQAKLDLMLKDLKSKPPASSENHELLEDSDYSAV